MKEKDDSTWKEDERMLLYQLVMQSSVSSTSQVFDVGCCSDKDSGDDDLSSKRTAAGAMCQRANVATGDYSFISLASLPDKFPFAKLSLIITPITTGSVPYIGRHRSI